MGGLPGPRGGGSPLSVMTCKAKTPLESGMVSVAFTGDNGSAVFSITAEEAEAFTVDQSYLFHAYTL